MVHAKGKPAQTKYEVLSENEQLSLVKLTPKTGRTHQLRVHLNYLNHPILGDRVYDKTITKAEAENRMFLHAQSLEITIPPKMVKKIHKELFLKQKSQKILNYSNGKFF